MFRTHEQGELPFGSSADGFRSWQYVEVGVETPWYIITLTRLIDGENFPSSILVWSVKVLEEILEEQDESNYVEGVQLVTPAHMNGSGGWLMEDVIEIGAARQNGRPDRLYVSRVKTGMYSFLGVVDPDTIHVERVIFQSTSIV